MTSDPRPGIAAPRLRSAASLAVGVLALVASVLVPAWSRGDSPPAAPRRPEAETLRGIDDVEPVASYTLRAKLDPDRHVVAGEGEIRFVNRSRRALDRVWVHLYMNAFESPDTIFRRVPATGMRGEDIVRAPGSIEVSRMRWVEAGGVDVWPADAHTPEDPRDRTDIEVPLPRVIAPGEAATFDVVFETKLPSIALRTGYFNRFHMVAQWFPKLAKLEESGRFAHFPFTRYSEFYADFGDYDVTVDVPEAFAVGATGTAIAEERGDGRRTTRFTQRAVIDFAFAAWDGFDEKQRTARGVTIRCLFPRGLDRLAEVELDAAAKGLAFFSDELGDYPYDRLTIVHPPDGADEAGGMEYPTLITTGGSGALGLVPALFLEGLTLHELAHQWFYGLVATNEHDSPFLDEGLTTYMTGRALDAIYGPRQVAPIAPFPVDLAEIERAAQLGKYRDAPVTSGAAEFPTGDAYGRLVYFRTATTLRTVDRVFDGAAGRTISAYARKHRFGHPSTRDFFDAFLAESAPADERDGAARLVSAALGDEASIDLAPISIQNRPQPDGGFVRVVEIQQKGELAVPFEVEIVSADGSRERVTVKTTAGASFVESPGKSPAVFVVVDPDHRVLLDESRLDDALSLEPHTVAPRTFWVAASLGSLLVHAVSP